jgi:hypothetical protein
MKRIAKPRNRNTIVGEIDEPNTLFFVPSIVAVVVCEDA